jgi:hypothetical protein
MLHPGYAYEAPHTLAWVWAGPLTLSLGWRRRGHLLHGGQRIKSVRVCGVSLAGARAIDSFRLAE